MSDSNEESVHRGHAGQGPPRDRTNQTIEFEHIHLSVFISIAITSALGWLVSLSLFAFNIHFRSHRSVQFSLSFQRTTALFQLHPDVQPIVEQSDSHWLYAGVSEYHLHGCQLLVVLLKSVDELHLSGE